MIIDDAAFLQALDAHMSIVERAVRSVPVRAELEDVRWAGALEGFWYALQKEVENFEVYCFRAVRSRIMNRLRQERPLAIPLPPAVVRALAQVRAEREKRRKIS